MGREEIEQWQVAAFNRVWDYCLRKVPFYKTWSAEHDLPSQISTVADISAFPVLTKKILVERTNEVFQDGLISDAYSTGGTSGTPTRFPRGGKNEALSRYADVYVTRGWWDLKPLDPYVHLWGHSHLFGSSRLGHLKRRLADYAVNATRLNAYDMSDEAMESHCETLERANPVYIVGYTSAIFKLARHIEAKGEKTIKLSRLKAVILTAESVSPADAHVISETFGVPVAIEYGAAETGTIAASRGEPWPLQVLWASFILQVGHEGNIHVTTLSDRLFPLVNYSIGDRAKPRDLEHENALLLDSILGREQDVVRMGTVDGKPLVLSAIMPIHILKLEQRIMAVQFRQYPTYLKIYVTTNGSLDLSGLQERFTREVQRDHPNFDANTVSFEQVESPLLTTAGKQALFV